ncbi:hypothetical protein ACS0TY_001799 [Phlomoides rotata]
MKVHGNLLIYTKRWALCVTSVKFAPDGRHIVVGLNNSKVQLWDFTVNRLLRTLKGGHISRVGATDWNHQILTTGGMDGGIFNTDVKEFTHCTNLLSSISGTDHHSCFIS